MCSYTILIHEVHQDQAATLVRARLTGIFLFPVVIQVVVLRVDPYDLTLVFGVLDEGCVLRIAAVDDQHPGRLEEHSLFGVSGVEDVLVASLRGRGVIGIAGETTTVEGVLFDNRSAWSFRSGFVRWRFHASHPDTSQCSGSGQGLTRFNGWDREKPWFPRAPLIEISDALIRRHKSKRNFVTLRDRLGDNGVPRRAHWRINLAAAFSGVFLPKKVY